MPKITTYRATSIVEGWTAPTSEAEYTEAWQHLIDNGDAFKLQGWISLMAHALIEEGACHLPIDKNSSVWS